MAASTREDRALMRVRGAGSRKVPTVDFGLNFAFGKNRQEGQQVPSPARSLHSTTKTLQTPRSTSRQPSTTPARRSQEPPSARSTRQSSVRSNEVENARTPEVAHIEERVRSVKRRRITPDAVTPNPRSSVEITRSIPTTRASRRRTASKIFTIAEDEDGTVATHPPGVDEQQQTSPLFVPQDEHQKENETPKDPWARSTAHDSTLQTTKSGRILRDPSTFPEDITEADVDVLELDTEEALPSLLETPSLQVSDAPSTSRQKKRRIRKPLTLERRKPRSSNRSRSVIASRESSVATLSPRRHSEDPSSSSILKMADRISKYSKLARTRQNRSQNLGSESDRTSKEADDGDESYVEESSPEPETPGVSKKASRQVRKRCSRSESAEAPEGKKGNPTFPILTHQLTNICTLPTINEEEGHEAPGTDAPVGFSNERAQPNAVDVLAQICRETISNMIDRIAEATQTSAKATSKNKRTALEAFGKDLNDELFAMSEAVENRINLEARVRKSRREKASLQTEYIELRKEREQIALKCDAVRRRHWECEEETREKWTVSEAARRAEQEMERNEAVEDEGLDFLLRSVTDSVSCVSGQCGILDRIKSFNAQLESMALLLEGGNVRRFG